MVAVGPSYRAVALTFLTGLLVTAADWPVRVAAVAPPALSAPANGAALARLATTLEWKLPAGATQVQLTLLPSNNDGPGINLIQNAAEQFAVLAPPE